MSPRCAGCVFVTLWIATAIVYDVIVYVWWDPAATISRTLRMWGQWTPLLVVPLGGLLWHLFGVARGRGWGLSAWDWACIAGLVVGAVLYSLIGIGRTPDIGPPTGPGGL